MKKIIALLMVMAMVLSLAACGAKEEAPAETQAAAEAPAAFPGALGWLAYVPTQLYQALPFVITAIVLVVSSIRTKENSGLPASLGVNYFREER